MFINSCAYKDAFTERIYNLPDLNIKRVCWSSHDVSMTVDNKLCANTHATWVVWDCVFCGGRSIKQEHVAESERSERCLGLRRQRYLGHPSLDRTTGGRRVCDSHWLWTAIHLVPCSPPPPPLSLYCIPSAVQKQPRCCCDATNGRCALTHSN